MMVVADDASDLPDAIFVLPEVNETGFAHAFGVFMARVMEAVGAHFDGAIPLHVVNLQCSGNEFASRFSANVLLHAFRERHFTERDAALIVVELDVVGKERGKFLEVAAIVRIEERGIERRNRFVEFRLIFDVVEGGHGLSGGSRYANREQR